jgi:hypothetical protein
MYVRKHFVFEVQPSRPPDLNPLDFCLWGHLKTMAYSAPLYNEQTLHKQIFMPLRPNSLKGRTVHNQICPSAHRGGGHFGICCKLYLDKQ